MLPKLAGAMGQENPTARSEAFWSGGLNARDTTAGPSAVNSSTAADAAARNLRCETVLWVGDLVELDEECLPSWALARCKRWKPVPA